MESFNQFKSNARTLTYLIEEFNLRINLNLTQDQKNYVDSLRLTYLDKLYQSKSDSEAQHYRHNKNLAPNSLRETITRINYGLVRPHLYKINSLSDLGPLNNEKLIEALEQEEKLLASVYQEEKAFSIISYEENGGTYGFNLSKILSDYDERINLFSLFLIDPILENNLKLLVSAE